MTETPYPSQLRVHELTLVRAAFGVGLSDPGHIVTAERSFALCGAVSAAGWLDHERNFVECEGCNQQAVAICSGQHRLEGW